MAKTPDETAGSGIDKPDPKTLLEKLGDGVKAVLPKSAEKSQTGKSPAGPKTD